MKLMSYTTAYIKHYRAMLRHSAMENTGVITLALLVLVSGVCSQQNLTFMFINSFGQFGFNSSGAIPAAEMAVEDINSNSNILPGYSLGYDKVRDSRVSAEIILLLQDGGPNL